MLLCLKEKSAAHKNVLVRHFTKNYIIYEPPPTLAPGDNQSPITRYTILYKPYSVDTWHEAGREQVYGSVTQATLNGLQPNTVYTIKIREAGQLIHYKIGGGSMLILEHDWILGLRINQLNSH